MVLDASWIYSAILYAVNIITQPLKPSSFKILATFSPEIYGILISKRTISGCNFLQTSTASIPSAASPTTS